LAIGAHGVRRASIEAGEFVLVIGAGPIGLGTIEFAKIAGARVIVLDINEHRLNFCREKLGISSIINGLKEDGLLKIKEITNGDMPTVVIDATGNLNAINKGFDYLAHGARFVLIGLQKETISVVHPEFHKREATLMSSRNATKMDFEHVISSMQKGLINPTNYITHSVHFDEVIDQFDSWLDPENHVIKAMVRF
jgi:threonine dehydrogenase-like Zn-dependent dehydrogenase